MAFLSFIKDAFARAFARHKPELPQAVLAELRFPPTNFDGKAWDNLTGGSPSEIHIDPVAGIAWPTRRELLEQPAPDTKRQLFHVRRMKADDSLVWLKQRHVSRVVKGRTVCSLQLYWVNNRDHATRFNHEDGGWQVTRLNRRHRAWHVGLVNVNSPDRAGL